MGDNQFLNAIFQVAGELTGRDLTDVAKEQIISEFNATKGNSYLRAKQAIRKVTGEEIPETFLLLESEGAINNLANKVAELKNAANAWVKQ